jgi:response regulator RpfG family c-di-GMP phosphodiesterase
MNLKFNLRKKDLTQSENNNFVLILSDDPESLLTVEILLKRYNDKILSTDSTDEALNLVQEFSVSLFLHIVTDSRETVDLMKKLEDINPDIKYKLITENSSFADCEPPIKIKIINSRRKETESFTLTNKIIKDV